MFHNHADFPSFHNDVKDFSTFEWAYNEIWKIVKDTICSISNPSFKAKKKFKAQKMNLEWIYETFWYSKDEERLKPLQEHKYPLDRKCVKNLYRLLWDEELVSFFVLWISAWVITLESSSWTQVFIELEAKFLWINQLEMAKLIHQYGWIERYKAMLADDYFTFWDDVLEIDGKRQIRIREKHKWNQKIDYTLTLKRKPSTRWNEYASLLKKYAESMDEDFNPQDLKKKMKALLEQEFWIHDNLWFREYLTQSWLYMSRSKIKLRRSCEFKWGKVEDESTFFESGIPPFAELEAPSEEILNMMIDLLNLWDKVPLITGSQWVYEHYGLAEKYLTYSQEDASLNNSMMQRRNAILNRWLWLIHGGHFDMYDGFKNQ